MCKAEKIKSLESFPQFSVSSSASVVSARMSCTNMISASVPIWTLPTTTKAYTGGLIPDPEGTWLVGGFRRPKNSLATKPHFQ